MIIQTTFVQNKQNVNENISTNTISTDNNNPEEPIHDKTSSSFNK